jgi:transposase
LSATVVKARTQLRLSLEPEAKALGLNGVLQALLKSHERLLQAIDAQIEALLAQAEQQQVAARLQSIVGVGTLSAAALLVALERGAFADADAFVAFLGLDPTPRDSGQSQGRRRLSKAGDSETRRLLFNAARSASLTKVWRAVYLRYVERGLTPIQALCILARKIARTAWSLYKHGTTFCPQRLTQALP